ncbi:MAG: VOC family protein [Burkholderiaceae bacterium]
MPQLNAYLSFDGNCAEAMRFYQKTIGGEIESMMTVAQTPMCDQMPAGSGDRIMHARLRVDQGVLMACDTMPGQTYEGIKGASMTLTYATPAEAAPVFDKLAQGGKVTMPMAKTFWAESFGMLTDRFGTTWLINGGMLQS